MTPIAYSTGTKLTGIIKNIEFNTQENQKIPLVNTSFVITIKTPLIPGDANGDGNVNISDAVAIVNYILGNASSNFVFEAADVNGDRKITISDAVGIVNIILNGSEATVAPALSKPE